MLIIRNINVYNPKYLGKMDVLIANDKIAMIKDKININEDIKEINGEGKVLVPGFVDNHIHITGGGGEGSFKTRVPEIMLSELVEAGITTVVGLLGTDSITRNVENVLAKAKALKEEGLTSYIYTGSYGYPSVTITGDVKKDIVFIDEVLGVKIALSDHRSPAISFNELSRLAADVRVAGMVSNKPGIVVAHMGDDEAGFSLINEVLEKTKVPVTTIRPTHVNRKDELLLEAYEYAKKGGIIDLTCGMAEDKSPAFCIKKAKEDNIPLENITVSTDGYGSWSNYDEKGNLLEMGASPVNTTFLEFQNMVNKYNFEIEEALIFFTSNVAKGLNIYPQKGLIAEGSDADLLILNENLSLEKVIARGQIMYEDGKSKKGSYE